MHISLTDTLDQYVRDKVASGLYNNASEVVREALRRQLELDARVKHQQEAFQRELLIGIRQADQGDFVEYSLADTMARLDAELAQGSKDA